MSLQYHLQDIFIKAYSQLFSAAFIITFGNDCSYGGLRSCLECEISKVWPTVNFQVSLLLTSIFVVF